MGLYINTNAAALGAQRNLISVNNRLRVNFRRLSSGLRINAASDDAAGLAISERFTSQIRGLNQAARNANDGISLTQVAEGALQETANILQRIRELSVQAASDVNNESDREAIQAEVDQLVDELNRIGKTTAFNATPVIDGSYVDQFVHIGMGFREARSISIDDAKATSLGRHAVVTSAAVSTLALAGDELAINGVTIRATTTVDDTVSTSLSTASAIAKAEAVNDFTHVTNVQAYANRTVRTGVAGIAGGTLDESNYIVINGEIITGINVAEGDADELLLRAINFESAKTGVVASRDTQGRIELKAEDGRNIEVETVGAAHTRTGMRAAAGTEVTFATMTFNSDEQFVFSGTAEAEVGLVDDALVGVAKTQVVETVDVTTRDGANLAILIADRALEQVSRTRTRLGAIQNRLEATVSNLAAVSEHASAARSRILDADFAVETADLARNQILQQAATNILAQANSQPQSALTLLQ